MPPIIKYIFSLITSQKKNNFSEKNTFNMPIDLKIITMGLWFLYQLTTHLHTYYIMKSQLRSDWTTI